MAARSAKTADRGWVVYTNWAAMTEAEQARTFDAAIPALMLAWCRSGELAELEASDGLGTGGALRDGDGVGDRVARSGHGGGA